MKNSGENWGRFWPKFEDFDPEFAYFQYTYPRLGMLVFEVINFFLRECITNMFGHLQHQLLEKSHC